MHKKSHKAPSQRQLRVGEQLRQVLGEFFMRGDLYHPLDNSVIQPLVSEVRCSPDLRNATVFIVPLDSASGESLIDRLSELGGYIRSRIASKVQLRHMPSLHFKIDQSAVQASRIDHLLDSPKVKRDLENAPEQE